MVVADVIMYHLMDERVFHLLFGQVCPGVDAQLEIIIFQLASAVSATFEDAFTQKGLRIRHLDGYRGKLAPEHLSVELVEFLLYVGLGWYHGAFSFMNDEKSFLKGTTFFRSAK